MSASAILEFFPPDRRAGFPQLGAPAKSPSAPESSTRISDAASASGWSNAQSTSSGASPITSSVVPQPGQTRRRPSCGARRSRISRPQLRQVTLAMVVGIYKEHLYRTSARLPCRVCVNGVHIGPPDMGARTLPGSPGISCGRGRTDSRSRGRFGCRPGGPDRLRSSSAGG